MDKENDTFCVLPFYGYEIPKNTHCCLLPKKHNIEKIKKDMLNGKKPVECNKCWFLEDRGLTSDREIKNRTLDYFLDRDIKYIKEDCHRGKYETLIYKIDTSFACNAACVTCGPGVSSYWAKLEKQKYSDSLTLDDVDKIVNYATAIDINFRGGEPLLSRVNFQILEKLLENNNNKCLISFTTNGSIKLNKRQLDIFSKFKNVSFNLSIDGTEKAFEYIRYPLNWKKLNENLKDYRKIANSISVSCTISNVSLLYYDKLVNWFDENKLPYNYNPVYVPEYFQPNALSKEVKNYILENTGSDVVRSLLKTHDNTDDDKFNQFKKQIAYQDGLKGIHIKDYLPELYDIIKFDH